MTNETLTERELTKVYAMYEDYGPEKLSEFIRMIWGEAYKLGLKDGEGAAYVRGWNERGDALRKS